MLVAWGGSAGADPGRRHVEGDVAAGVRAEGHALVHDSVGPKGRTMPMSDEPRNLWISASEHEAVIVCLTTIEQGVCQLRADRAPVRAAEPAARRDVLIAAIEGGCRRLRALLDAITDDDAEAPGGRP